MKLLKYVIFIICFALQIEVQAQELNAAVRVQAPNLGLSDKSVIGQMEKSITEFLNNQKFTSDNFGPKERIKCNFQITIRQDAGNNSFVGDLFVQAVRPVFNSNYETNLINLLDKEIPMRFDPFRPLENSKDNYFDNLSSVLTYYAYVIIMMDYESFELDGGEQTMNLIQNMINVMPASAKSIDKSWAGGTAKKTTRNDYIENIQNSRAKPFRRAYYEYHRLGLDILEKDQEQARKIILSSLESVQNVDKSFPNSYLIQLFCTSKSLEIVEIFKKASPDEKNKVYQIMISIDPANAANYNPIKS